MASTTDEDREEEEADAIAGTVEEAAEEVGPLCFALGEAGALADTAVADCPWCDCSRPSSTSDVVPVESAGCDSVTTCERLK